MAVIYENKVKELGKDIMMMNGGDFIIIFGDSAPAELRDYCYSVDVNPINGEIKADSGWTDIFITPGYEFKVVEAFSTNFHLPKSTLVMLVSAFAGRELTLSAYQHAIDERYRFFSFGDAMFVK